MSKKTSGIRYSESTMYPLIEMYEHGEMTQKQFCRKHKVSAHTFSYWLAKYRKTHTQKSADTPAPKFKQLAFSKAQEDNGSLRHIRITYPDGTSIELPVW